MEEGIKNIVLEDIIEDIDEKITEAGFKDNETPIEDIINEVIETQLSASNIEETDDNYSILFEEFKNEVEEYLGSKYEELSGTDYGDTDLYYDEEYENRNKRYAGEDAYEEEMGYDEYDDDVEDVNIDDIAREVLEKDYYNEDI